MPDRTIGHRHPLAHRARCGGEGIRGDGADFYQSPEAIEEDVARGRPPVGIGEGSVVERAIVDKGALIGRGARIVNRSGRAEEDGENYVIRDGIVVIPKDAVVPDGAEI